MYHYELSLCSNGAPMWLSQSSCPISTSSISCSDRPLHSITKPGSPLRQFTTAGSSSRRRRSISSSTSFAHFSRSADDAEEQRSAVMARISTAAVIACVRASSAELALDLSRAALDGGITALEVTMTSPGATQVINRLVGEYPSALIGAGTILSINEANDAVAAGASFLMSPGAVKGLLEMYCHGSSLFIPGTMTPTEVINAYNLGAQMLKLYPVALLGGVQFVQAVKKMQIPIHIIASQGISIEMVELYVTAGATAVVLSDAIFDKTSVAARDFERIKQQARVAAEKGAIVGKNAIRW